MTRGLYALGLILMAASAAPATAQQATSPPGLPAATGKPLILTLPPAPPTDRERGLGRDCPDGPLCSLRVIGSVRRNGAVELNATALRW